VLALLLFLRLLDADLSSSTPGGDFTFFSLPASEKIF
jgi:hypothetical protein